MTGETVFHVVTEVLGQRLKVDPATITRETTAEDIDGWDSVTHTLVVLELERRLGIALDVIEVLELANVGDLVDLAAREVARK